MYTLSGSWAEFATLVHSKGRLKSHSIFKFSFGGSWPVVTTQHTGDSRMLHHNDLYNLEK